MFTDRTELTDIGVSIFTKDNLNVSGSLATSVTKQFDCLVLNVGLGHYNQLKLVGVYRPPSSPFIFLNCYPCMVYLNY